MTWRWILIEQDCTGCGICNDVCPEGAIIHTPDMAYPEPVPERCSGCLDCLRECPFDALIVEAADEAQSA